MHYYQHNIKDFNNATRHLTRVERCSYRDAIELYYDTESPLTGDFERLSRKLLCVTTEEKDALMYILNEFFYLVDGEYRHTRCDFEIEKFHNVKTAKAAAGKASAESKRKKRESKKEQNQTEVKHVLKSVDTEYQHISTNQEPITNNQQPLINIRESNKSPAVNKPKFCPVHFASSEFQSYEIDLESWTEWCEFRRESKKPITKASASKQLKMLVKYNLDDQKLIIDKSIMNGYQGLFDLKNNSGQSIGSFQNEDFMDFETYEEKYT